MQKLKNPDNWHLIKKEIDFLDLVKEKNRLEFFLLFPPVNIAIKVISNSNKLMSFIKDNFSFTENYSNNYSATIFIKKEKLKTFSNKLLYSTEERISVFTTIAEYSDITYSIYGLVSFLGTRKGFVPVHASAITVGEIGKLFIGSTRSGKTFQLLREIKNTKQVHMPYKVASDDWGLLQFFRSKLIFSSIDQVFSIRKSNLEEFNKIFESNMKSSNEKLRIPFKNMLFDDCLADTIEINYISTLSEKVFNKMSFINYVINSTSHYPYLLNSDHNTHKNFWSSVYDRFEVKNIIKK